MMTPRPSGSKRRTQTSSFRAQSRNPCLPSRTHRCCDYAQHDGVCRAPPHSSLLTPHSSLLTPHSSLLTPHSSLLTPHSSPLTLHPSLLTPHSSLLTPHSSLLTPHSSLLTPHSSLLTPHSSLLTPHSSLLTPHSSLLTPHSSGAETNKCCKTDTHYESAFMAITYGTRRQFCSVKQAN